MKIINKYQFIVLATPSIILSIVSFSRMSWLLLAFFWIFTQRERNNKTYVLNKIHIILSLILTIGITSLFINKLKTSDLYRLDEFRLYFEHFNELGNKSFFGIGLGQYTLSLRENFKLMEWQYIPIHNFILLMFAELGLFNILALLGINYREIMKMIKKYAK